MIETSTMSGTLLSSKTPSVSSVVAISLSTEFFAPGTTTVPDSGPVLRTTIVSTAAPDRFHDLPVCSRRAPRRANSHPTLAGDPHHLDEITRPRDDLVLESAAPTGPHRGEDDGRVTPFDQEHGPFSTYRGRSRSATTRSPSARRTG